MHPSNQICIFGITHFVEFPLDFSLFLVAAEAFTIAADKNSAGKKPQNSVGLVLKYLPLFRPCESR